MANLGDCAPPNPGNQPSISIHSDSDKATGYRMNYDDFFKMIAEKERIFDVNGQNGTDLDVYLDVITNVIHKNCISYDQILDFINDLADKKSELNQFGHLIEHVPMVRPYPWPKYYEKYVRDKESLVKKLTLLLYKLVPAYKYNEQMVKMLSNIDLNTRIDFELNEQMSKEANKVIDIHNYIGALFAKDKFEIFEFKVIYEAQQLATDRLQSKERGFGLDKADTATNVLIAREGELFRRMMKIVDEALELDFNTLTGSTEHFYELFHESISHHLQTCASSSLSAHKRSVHGMEHLLLDHNKKQKLNHK